MWHICSGPFVPHLLVFVLHCFCVFGTCNGERLIIKFNNSMRQAQQKQYLDGYLYCPRGQWQYLYRSYLSVGHLTDFAVVETDSYSSLSSCISSLELVQSVHFDQPCSINSRKLMGVVNSHTSTTNGKIAEDMYFRPQSLSSRLNARGIRGKGVKVAVFDTGLAERHPHFGEYARYDWTDEDTLDDYIGHGTFVAGVIASKSESCGGIAPEVDLHVFRIFTKNQKAYTSWFLDAFNMAIFLGIDVLNLSIGGPDHHDIPFMTKVDEMAAHGIIVVSAIGNDGPLWGSSNNPADQSSVIGVGGWHEGNKVSAHSSRGMTTWEYPLGSGRVKPDLVSPSHHVLSSSLSSSYVGAGTDANPHATSLSGCRPLSGTSVANPIVTAAVALLLSAAPSPVARLRISNVAAMKQILMKSADTLHADEDTPSICEQGAGLVNIYKAYEEMLVHSPHVSVWPARLSNHPEDCPLLWPYCAHQLFISAEPLLANITIFNSVSRVGHILLIRYTESSASFGESVDEISLPSPQLLDLGNTDTTHHVTLRGDVLTVEVETNRILWPWVGYLAVAITVNPAMKFFRGNVSGSISILVQDASADNRETGHGGATNEPREDTTELHEAILDIDVVVTETPMRRQRVLWDVFHSISYPSPYVPNDNTADTRTVLDLLGDHPHSNYRDAYMNLQNLGYVVEVLRGPWTCFDASLYSILIVSDVEENIAQEEIDKLEYDIKEAGLSVLIATDWFDEMSLLSVPFYDDNTHSTWYPITGGSNVPTVNRFLERFGMRLGHQVFNGWFDISKSERVSFLYGNTLSAWPRGGYILRSQAGQLSPVNGGNLRGQFSHTQVVLGLYNVGSEQNCNVSCGKLAVYGDTSFLDMSAMAATARGVSAASVTGTAADKRLLENIMKFLELGNLDPFVTGGMMERLDVDSFSDDRLMQPLSATRTVNAFTLDSERVVRGKEHERYAKIFEDSSVADLEDICRGLL